jgi:hypothetical protein
VTEDLQVAAFAGPRDASSIRSTWLLKFQMVTDLTYFLDFSEGWGWGLINAFFVPTFVFLDNIPLIFL